MHGKGARGDGGWGLKLTIHIIPNGSLISVVITNGDTNILGLAIGYSYSGRSEQLAPLKRAIVFHERLEN